MRSRWLGTIPGLQKGMLCLADRFFRSYEL